MTNKDENNLKLLIQFVEIGKVRNKVFRELGEKQVSEICKLKSIKKYRGRQGYSANYHTIHALIDKGLVEFVKPVQKCKTVQLTELGVTVYEKIK